MTKPINILVTDDEKEIADLLEIYLVSDGYKVFKASNAQDGLDILDKEDIHLCLLDIMMPGMNGLEMCKKIKKSGCNVLLVQKSILRDAVNELSLHFLSKLKIMVISDIERDDIEFIARVGFRVFSHADARLSAGGARRLLHRGQAGSRGSRRGGGAGGPQDHQDHRRRQPRQDRLRAAARLQQAGAILSRLSRRCSTSPSGRCMTRSVSCAVS